MVFGSAVRDMEEGVENSIPDLNDAADILDASVKTASLNTAEFNVLKKQSNATPNSSPPQRASIHISAAPEPLLTNSMTSSMIRDANQVSSPHSSPTHSYLPKDDVNAPFLALNPPALPLIPDYVMEKAERKRRDSNDSYASRH